MFVNNPYIWENIKGLENHCEHPNSWDLRMPYVAVSVPEYLNLKDEALENEHKRNYDDTQVRVTTVMLVYWYTPDILNTQRVRITERMLV